MDNCFNSTKQLLKLLKIDQTNKYLKDSLFSHPNHPSLISISDTLEKYNVETLGIKIDESKLDKVPTPFIIQVEKNDQPYFFVLKSMKDDRIEYYDENNKLVKGIKADLLEFWTGVCLLIKKTENSKEIDIEAKKKSLLIFNILKISLPILFFFWVLESLFSSNMFNLSLVSNLKIGYFLMKLLGGAIGVVLLWYEVDRYNPVVQSFCSGQANSRINCNSVLSSKYSKLFNGALSLGLVGFAYFFGTSLNLIMNNFSPIAFGLSGIISYMTIPVVVWSLYYQSIVLRQWCKFCIFIQGILLSEVITSFYGGFLEEFSFYNSYQSMFSLLLLIVIPILVWLAVKPLIEQSKKSSLFQRSLSRIKNKPEILETLLKNSKRVSNDPKGISISFNKTAKYNVIKVCNPYCGPCSKAHPILEDLVKRGKINLQILFAGGLLREEGNKNPVNYFLDVYENGSENEIQEILDDWYLSEDKKVEELARKYPLKGSVESYHRKIEKMKAWCENENVTRTPTIFIDGYELPADYNVADLRDVLV